MFKTSYYYQQVQGIEVSHEPDADHLRIGLALDWSDPKNPTLAGIPFETTLSRKELEQRLRAIKYLRKNTDIPIRIKHKLNLLTVQLGHPDFTFLNFCLFKRLVDNGDGTPPFYAWKLETGYEE